MDYESLLHRDEKVLDGLVTFVKAVADRKDIVAQISDLIKPSMAHHRSDTLKELGDAPRLYKELKQKSEQSAMYSLSYNGTMAK